MELHPYTYIVVITIEISSLYHCASFYTMAFYAVMIVYFGFAYITWRSARESSTFPNETIRLDIPLLSSVVCLVQDFSGRNSVPIAHRAGGRATTRTVAADAHLALFNQRNQIVHRSRWIVGTCGCWGWYRCHSHHFRTTNLWFRTWFSHIKRVCLN